MRAGGQEQLAQLAEKETHARREIQLVLLTEFDKSGLIRLFVKIGLCRPIQRRGSLQRDAGNLHGLGPQGHVCSDELDRLGRNSVPSGSMPSCSNRAVNLGSLAARANASAIRSTMASGVPVGASAPCQLSPWNPEIRIQRWSAPRVPAVPAWHSIRRSCGRRLPAPAAATWTADRTWRESRPPIRSVRAGAVPR